MLEQLLNAIATLYYPAGISPLKDYERYIKSVEFFNLIKRLKEGFNQSNFQGIRLNLMNKFNEKNELRGIQDFTLESSDKCLTFKLEIFEDNKLYQVCANISILVPYYLVYVLENKISRDPYRWIDLPLRNENLEIDRFSNHLQCLSNIIEAETSFMPFPKVLLNKVLPDLGTADIELNNLTFLNAFFLNDLKL